MNTVVLACRTIAHEITSTIRDTGVSYPVHWIDSQLHSRPEKLGAEIQSKIDSIENADTIILAFGLCGNGLLGIRSKTARLIVPKTEDCISLLLGSQERRTKLAQEAPRYYFSKGWLESPNCLADEYDYCVRRFGRQKGRMVMGKMLKGYRYFSFIETGGYDSAPYIAKTETLARELEIDHQIIDGENTFLEKLLLGPWDHNFIVVEPDCAIQFAHFFPKPTIL